MSKNKQTAQATVIAVTVSTILDNLSTAHGDKATLEYSNAAKAFERKEWLKSAIRDNRLTDFLLTLESAINALPQGTIEVTTKSRKTGEDKVKKINYRDVAKASYKKAFNNAVTDLPLCQVADQELTWKLSRPELTTKVVKVKTLQDRIASVLGETVDSTGLSVIMLTIAEQQDRIKQDIKVQGLDLEFDALRSDYLAELVRFLKRGKTEQQAVNLASEITGFNTFDLDITASDLAAIAEQCVTDAHLNGMAKRAMAN